MKKQRFKETENVVKTNGYAYAVIFVIFTLLFEMVNFATLGIGLLPTRIGLELSVVLIICGIIVITPTEWLKITITSLFLFVQAVLNIINACIYKNLYNITTIDMLFARGGETGAVFEFDMLNLPSLIITLLLIGLYILAIIFAVKLFPKIEIKKGATAMMCLLVATFTIEGTGLSCYNLFNNAYTEEQSSIYAFENGYYMYGSNAIKFLNMQRYGFYGFYIKSLEQYLGYAEPISETELKALKKFVEDGKDFEYTGSTYKTENVSGKLAGDNLIVIMIESGEWFGIDPILTPTLYDFMHNQSVCFSNFYSRNPTNFSEDICLLGNTPNDYALSKIVKNPGITTPTSLPNLFKQNGYESVKFFHDYLGTFYSRKDVNTSIGFDEVYALEDSTLYNPNVKFGEFVDDGDFIDACKEEFMPADKSFFSFFTSVSMHGPYTKENERFADYYDQVDLKYNDFCQYAMDMDLGYTLPAFESNEYKIFREYKAKTMALENMINVILDRLENTTDIHGDKLIDTTTIVMFADHNAYYQDLSYKIKDIGEYDDTNKAYNVPMVIFNKKLVAEENTTFCNTYDLYPTLCDLYGFKFNRNLAQGHSIFAEDIKDSVFISSMASIFDEDYYSLTLRKIYDVKTGELEERESKLKKFKTNVSNFLKKQAYIETYYRINYEKTISEST